MLLETKISRKSKDKDLLDKYIKDNNVVMIEKMKAKQVLSEWMSKSNTKYQLTITFPKFTDEVWTRRLLNTLIKNLNRSIYKKRFSESKSCIKGFAIRERKKEMMTDHYHILFVDDGWLPDEERMKHLIDKHVNLLKIDPKTGKRRKHYIADAFLQNYYNLGDDDLEIYLSKQFEFLSVDIQQALDSIAVLDFGDVAFGRDTFTTYH